MGAIIYFEKSVEDAERVTYRYGTEEQDFAHSLVIDKTGQLPVDVDPEKASVSVQIAFGGILKSFRTKGVWPDSGAGYG